MTWESAERSLRAGFGGRGILLRAQPVFKTFRALPLVGVELACHVPMFL
ncbi:MAG TPA: hypothetical protein VMV34_04925 [Terriglobia bacterium]|nr:hypothetical protein [Terriglobia bacterium]